LSQNLFLASWSFVARALMRRLLPGEIGSFKDSLCLDFAVGLCHNVDYLNLSTIAFGIRLSDLGRIAYQPFGSEFWFLYVLFISTIAFEILPKTRREALVCVGLR
jgi:hypothetical protein